MPFTWSELPDDSRKDNVKGSVQVAPNCKGHWHWRSIEQVLAVGPSWSVMLLPRRVPFPPPLLASTGGVHAGTTVSKEQIHTVACPSRALDTPALPLTAEHPLEPDLGWASFLAQGCNAERERSPLLTTICNAVAFLPSALNCMKQGLLAVPCLWGQGLARVGWARNSGKTEKGKWGRHTSN